MFQRIMPWLLGLLWSHLWAAWVLHRTAAEQRERALDLAASGLFSVPTPPAVAALATWPAAMTGALAFTFTLGLLICAVARAGVDLLAVGHRLLRFLPLLACAIALLIGLTLPHGGIWIGLALLFAIPYGLFLALSPRRHSVAARAALCWLCAALLLVPVVWSASPDHLRTARTAIVGLPAGEALVNAYYRSALLAAEPIKGPHQRFHVTYSALGATHIPDWIRCKPGTPLLLPVADPANADLRVLGVIDDAVHLEGFPEPVEADAWGERFAAWMAANDPAVLRALVALGVIGGLPLVLALAVASGVYRIAGRAPRRQWRVPITVMACAGLGGVCAVLILAVAERAPPEPVVDGHGAERIAAASARSTSLRDLERLASDDELLPVRAHALAEQVRRARTPAEWVDPVRAATTWYEQWHGYNALLARGWDPRGQVC